MVLMTDCLAKAVQEGKREARKKVCSVPLAGEWNGE
jgi:hypothetical protein